jgi:hypothetical protein
MTTYRYRLVLDDSEVIAVQEALVRYLETGQGGGLLSGRRNKASKPHMVNLLLIKNVLGRLQSDPVMTSTSSFCRPSPERP